jgi:transposase InsO family protein
MENAADISLSGCSAKLNFPASAAVFRASLPPNPEAGQRIDNRLKAVMALFRGEHISDVQEQFGICRSDLYKFKHRAVEAVREALADKKRGAQTPSNRTEEKKEDSIKAICERHPTLSSYQVKERLGADAPTARTIQRVRKRLALPRLNKRPAPSYSARRLTADEKKLVQETATSNLHLGCYRLCWDLQNRDGLRVSPSTTNRVKRKIIEETTPKIVPVIWKRYERKHPHSLWHGDFMEKVTLTDEERTAYQLTLQDDYSRAYLFCDLFLEPDVTITIKALIAAMRQFQTIPKMLLFDNGAHFKGNLLGAFCGNLGIRLIHSTPSHPQTNGKLERAFRDDMKDFYRRYAEWKLDELRKDLPGYVEYRNNIRGHWALGGKPACARLREQDWFALPSILEQLEGVARYPMRSRTIGLNQCIRLLGANAHIPDARYNETVALTETINGLEAETQDGRRFLLRDYRRLLNGYEPIPFLLRFQPLGSEAKKLIANAAER